jgi:hypothetical protein
MIVFPSLLMTWVQHRPQVDAPSGLCRRRLAGWLSGLHCGCHGARYLLPPLDFGKPAGDMGMLRIERTDLLKGSTGFVKLPLHQTRVPVHKSFVHDVVMWLPRQL